MCRSSWLEVREIDMSHTETINKVPNEDVPQIQGDFESQGATVVVTPDGDGTSKIVATFSDTATVALNSATAAHASAAAAHASAADAFASALKIIART